MKKLSRITLNNFQNHKYTSLDLHPGINLITGSSDAGKSAILRAMNWVLHNKPTRANFVTNGEKETSVCIEFIDGNKVTRIKSSDKNAVIWEDENGVIHEFEKIGTSLPVEVEKAMGFPPIDERHGPISYSDQLVNLYLVSLSPTDLPRALSELTGINDFEEAIQELSRQKRESEKDITNTQKHMDGLNEQLKEYDNLTEQVTFVENNANLITQIEVLQTHITNLQKYSNQRIFIKDTAESLMKKNKISKQKIQYSDDTEQARKLCDVLNEAKDIQNKNVSLNKTIKEKENIISIQNQQLRLISDDVIDNLHILAKNITIAKTLSKDYILLSEQNDEYSKQGLAKMKIIKDMENEKQTIIETLKEQGEWCERCKRPIPYGVVHND